MDVHVPAAVKANGCKHIVLVHGSCLGGWSWFKVATRLRAAGYRVDTPDMAACGVDPRPLREAPTLRDYTEPLLDLLASLPAGDRVVLVGHSFGGLSVALAAEMFPDKVAAAVFLCAFMPDCAARPSHVLEKLVEGKWLDWMDTEFKPLDAEGKLPTSMLFGPRILRDKFFQLCSPELPCEHLFSTSAPPGHQVAEASPADGRAMDGQQGGGGGSDCDAVGGAFVEYYYRTFDAGDRAALAALYGHASMLSFEGHAVAGAQEIGRKLAQLPFQQCRHAVCTVDCQPSPAVPGGILVFVSGSLQLDGEEHQLRFSQMFQLVPSEQGSFFVQNDIFRLNYG